MVTVFSFVTAFHDVEGYCKQSAADAHIVKHTENSINERQLLNKILKHNGRQRTNSLRAERHSLVKSVFYNDCSPDASAITVGRNSEQWISQSHIAKVLTDLNIGRGSS